MKTRLLILALLAISLLSSCSNSSDEPNIPYIGPWIVMYDEDYYGIHNDSEEFNKWFEDHNKFFSEARFVNGLNSWSFDSSTDYPILEDYKHWFSGALIWYEVIPEATESELEKVVKDFEDFSIPPDKNNYYDSFQAIYAKYDE